MLAVIHGVSWLFILISLCTGPVFGLGMCVCVRVSSCGCVLDTLTHTHQYRSGAVGEMKSYYSERHDIDSFSNKGQSLLYFTYPCIGFNHLSIKF
jgi:hypothetical protein